MNDVIYDNSYSHKKYVMAVSHDVQHKAKTHSGSFHISGPQPSLKLVISTLHRLNPSRDKIKDKTMEDCSGFKPNANREPEKVNEPFCKPLVSRRGQSDEDETLQAFSHCRNKPVSISSHRRSLKQTAEET